MLLHLTLFIKQAKNPDTKIHTKLNLPSYPAHCTVEEIMKCYLYYLSLSKSYNFTLSSKVTVFHDGQIWIMHHQSNFIRFIAKSDVYVL